MKIELTKQECFWLSELVKKEKTSASLMSDKSPSRLFELRRDNMQDLEDKLNNALQREIKKERNSQR